MRFGTLLSAFMFLFASVSVTSSVHADAMSDWRKTVVKKVAKKQTYPRSALAREIEGRARVRIFVSKDGTITNHELVEPTGERVLDREIPKLMKRLSPLPNLPEGEEDMSFILPLNWSLN